MIGVASRKANRAASLCESPMSRPPPIVAPEREKPGISAIACAAPTKNAPRQRDGARDARVVLVVRDRRAPAQQLGAVEQEAVQRQEDRGRLSARRTPCAADARAAARGSRPGSCRRRAASRASRRRRLGSMPRSRSERPRPRRMRTQSRQKKTKSTIAVARCVATGTSGSTCRSGGCSSRAASGG